MVSALRKGYSLLRDVGEDALLVGLPAIHSLSSFATESHYSPGIHASPIAKGLMGKRPQLRAGLILLASDWFRSGHVTQLWPMRMGGLTEGPLGKLYCFFKEVLVFLLLLSIVMSGCDAWSFCSYLVTA